MVVAIILARKLGRLAATREVLKWAEEARDIDEWAADLGLLVDWCDGTPGAKVAYVGNSQFAIGDELAAVHFQLRFG